MTVAQPPSTFEPFAPGDVPHDELRQQLGGTLLTAADDGYDEARELWNGMIDRRPALVARCTGAADVMASVDFAREHGLLTSVRGGGHNIAGSAVAEGGLMIDLAPMEGVRVDVAEQRVRVGPGACWGDVDRETQAHGLVVPSGIVSTTGVAGLTLGGGFGWLTRRWGLTCDHLLSADVVTADGRLLKASAAEHPDLFWALKGGGGNFGAVTSFEFRARELGPEVTAGLVLHSMDDAERVVELFREVTADAPEELATLLVLRIAPPAPFLPKSVHGKPVAGIAVCWAGDPADGEEAVAPIREGGSPLADAITVKPFRAHQQMLDAAQPHGRHYYWKSDYLPGLDDDAAAVLLEHARNLPSTHSAVLLMHLGGAASRVDAAESAAPHRDAPFILNIAAAWDPPTEAEPCIRWARDFWGAMRPHSTERAYVNFLTEDEGTDRMREAYGESYDRLVEVKRRHDPENLFRSNQNIPPTG